MRKSEVGYEIVACPLVFSVIKKPNCDHLLSQAPSHVGQLAHCPAPVARKVIQRNHLGELTLWMGRAASRKRVRGLKGLQPWFEQKRNSSHSCPRWDEFFQS